MSEWGRTATKWGLTSTKSYIDKYYGKGAYSVSLSSYAATNQIAV